jgi:holo-[acyl-carrier protein] synthase
VTPRPPAGLAVGIDLVDVREIAESIALFGDRYVKRIFTEAEAAYARAVPGEMARRLGARFAAKEAVRKTLPLRDRGVAWRSIEVVLGAGGAPQISLSATALEAAREAGLSRFSVSLTHQGEIAAAIVVAEHVRMPKSRIWLRRASRARRGARG